MPSIRDLAAATDLSVATVSLALRGDPRVRKSTADRVLKAAKKIGYQNNQYVGELMSSMRRQQVASFRGNLAIVWPDVSPLAGRNDPWQFGLQQIRKGAEERAAELGYNLGHFLLSEYSPRQLVRVLFNRGVRGVIIGPSYTAGGKTHLRIELAKFACVNLGWALFSPALHSIRFDAYQSMQLALHHAHHRFGNRIAAFFGSSALRRTNHNLRAAFLVHHPAGARTASELFFDSDNLKPAEALAAMKRHKVECVIGDLELIDKAPLLGSKEVIFWNYPDEKPCFGWIDSQYSLLGRWGIETLASSLHTREFGPPKVPKSILIPGRWVSGKPD